MHRAAIKRVLGGLFIGVPVAVFAFYLNHWILIDILPEYGDYPKVVALSISILLLAMSLDSCRMSED